MIEKRNSNDRGHTDIGWLDSRHTFSFGDYYDDNHMGFRALRVINDDRVAPKAGFPTHPHRDMEIVSYVLEGELAHGDTMGNKSVIGPGEVQRMSAGTGVLHSEFNPSAEAPVHFLQIWLMPDKRGIQPGYEQKKFAETELQGKLRLVAAPDGKDGAVKVHQDVRLFVGKLSDGDTARLDLDKGRHAWVQVARGSVEANGVELKEGDGAALSNEAAVVLKGRGASEVLVFDLA